MNDTYFFGKRMSFNEGGRARFNVGGTGNKDAEEQGFNYISNNQYLQDDFKSTDGISYEGDGSPVSYANSMGGIMSQAPIIYPPIINQGGGGGGGPPTGPAPDTSFDYETEAYGLNDLSATEKGLTEEEQEALDNQIAGPQLGKFGTLGTIAGMFTAPLTTINFHRMRNKRIEKELEEKTRQAGIEADFQREAAKGNSGAEFTGGRYDGAKDKASYDKDPTSYSGSSKDGGLIGYGGKSGTPVYQQYLNGGRAGYFFGGRVNYKVGGRTDAESQYGAGSVGSYDSSANQSDRKQSYGNNNPPVSTRNDNKIVTTDFINQTGTTQVSFTTRAYPNSTPVTTNFPIDSTTTFKSTRIRARSIALKVSNTGSNQDWKLGTFRLDVAPGGMR